MADQSPAQTAILYQNAAKTLTLLDIPTSISLAQRTTDCQCTDRLYSSPALRAPYPSVEPKSEKAKANVLRTKKAKDAEADFPEALLRQGMKEIAEHWEGDWCLSRKVSQFLPDHKGKKCKAEDSADERLKAKPLETEPDLRIPEAELNTRRIDEPLIFSGESTPRTYTCSNKRHITNRLVHNQYSTLLILKYSGTSYRIPPCASFLMSRISESTATALSLAAISIHSSPTATAGPGQFDFVLLDPPWENRSVQRSGRYTTMRETDPMVVLQSILGQHLAHGALVACWVTNKPAARNIALEAFQAWDVDLVEEWAWLKTTLQGDPVTELEGLWRKPYEILLLGRKVSTQAHGDTLQRRVIVAVPDLHSRKPSLKALIESFMPSRYRALEIFARNLTADWWAWGDEVLKYNWEGHWWQGEESVQIQD